MNLTRPRGNLVVKTGPIFKKKNISVIFCLSKYLDMLEWIPPKKVNYDAFSAVRHSCRGTCLASSQNRENVKERVFVHSGLWTQQQVWSELCRWMNSWFVMDSSSPSYSQEMRNIGRSWQETIRIPFLSALSFTLHSFTFINLLNLVGGFLKLGYIHTLNEWGKRYLDEIRRFQKVYEQVIGEKLPPPRIACNRQEEKWQNWENARWKKRRLVCFLLNALQSQTILTSAAWWMFVTRYVGERKMTLHRLIKPFHKQIYDMVGFNMHRFSYFKVSKLSF